ncbi:MAG: MltA domain-containing protein [Elusimicrobia bacterium]|nr:MltA domain-containing protein [Elusimicrobiota bacterium]
MPLLQIGLILLAVGCAQAQTPHAASPLSKSLNSAKGLRRVAPENYPAFLDDLDLASLPKALQSTLDWWEAVDPKTPIPFGGQTVLAERIQKTFRRFLQLLAQSPSRLPQEIPKEFLIFESVGEGESGAVTWTGYFEAQIEASRLPQSSYRFPLYRRPPDLRHPYFTRREIDLEGALTGQNLELAWALSPAEVFFLQTQGSGWLKLPDSQAGPQTRVEPALPDHSRVPQEVRVLFAGHNGHPYRSVRQRLIEEGKIPPDSTASQVLQYLKSQSPAVQYEILAHNPRYSFFQLSAQDSPPTGTLGLPLTPGRSIAIDAAVLPLGALGFISSTKPVADEEGRLLRTEPFTRFGVTQDTGGALRGPGRADLFWGRGVRAQAEAGAMLFPGKLYFLLLAPEKKKK